LKNHNLYNNHDLDQLNSLIQYLQQLNVSTIAYSSNNSQEDFMRSQEEKSLLKFLSEYKNRRNKTEETLSQGFKDWIKCVRDRHEE
jgi:hypothetical protein